MLRKKVLPSFRVIFSIEIEKKLRKEKIKEYFTEFFHKVQEESDEIASYIVKEMEKFKEIQSYKIGSVEIPRETLIKDKNKVILHFYERVENFDDFYITFQMSLDKLNPIRKSIKNKIENICKEILVNVDEESEKIVNYFESQKTIKTSFIKK
jgi:hypothetical protein